ncbi:hypothetical protein CRUP_025330 [Coryphaenoides rupestris]|nr:hypothetical protein CRUP_025330 [Coryphaenoides rupestris]
MEELLQRAHQTPLTAQQQGVVYLRVWPVISLRTITQSTSHLASRPALSCPSWAEVISRTFLGICMTPESPSSPETHTQGLEVVMALLSVLMGTMTARPWLQILSSRSQRLAISVFSSRPVTYLHTTLFKQTFYELAVGLSDDGGGEVGQLGLPESLPQTPGLLHKAMQLGMTRHPCTG